MAEASVEIKPGKDEALHVIPEHDVVAAPMGLGSRWFHGLMSRGGKFFLTQFLSNIIFIFIF